jgi:methionine-rich copper-binding protein CopC
MAHARRWLVATLLAVGIVGTASSHAYLDASAPAHFEAVDAVETVVLRFTSDVEPTFSSFELRRLALPDGAWPADPAALTDAERMRLSALAAQQFADADPEGAIATTIEPGRRTPEVSLTPAAPLEPGAYAVAFEVLAVDGHTTSDHVVFFVVTD